MPGIIERRYISQDETEIRLDKKETGDILEGYAAVFDKWTQIGDEKWGWREIVRDGAFKKTIQEADIRGLINHDENLLLARTKAGTLRLTEDKRGLHYDMDSGNQSYWTDLKESINRGDITGNSFTFKVVQEKWNNERDKRELLELKLRDVGPVTFPAYEGTSLKLRSIIDGQIDFDEINGIIIRHGAGLLLTDDNHKSINKAIESLRSYLPITEPLPEEHSLETKRLHNKIKMIIIKNKNRGI